jgi:hypothetical protein
LEPDLVTPLEHQQMRVAGETGDTFWHRVRFRLVHRAAARHHATTVLDIGAGSGQLGDWLARSSRPLQYQFEEASPVLDTALAAHFGADHRGDPRALIPATTIVTMLDVLEHIEDDLGVLRSIQQRMEPGAQLLLTVPAFQWAFTSWDTSLGHHRRYSRAQVRTLAQAAGFRVDHCSYIFPELLPLVLVRKLQRGEREHADFPKLPRIVDRSAELFSRGTTAIRRIWPGGTSVTALLTKAGSPR